MPRKRRIGKARPELHVERFRTVLMFKWDYFGELGDDTPTYDELRRAWAVLRESILQDFADNPKQRAGRRPYGYWIFDVGLDGRPSDDEQLTYLQEHNLLTPTEKAVLAEREARRLA